MKKISFKNLDNLGIEKISREKLKNVTGGDSNIPSFFAECYATCYCPPGYVPKESNQNAYGVGIDCPGGVCEAEDGWGVSCSNGSQVLCDPYLNCEPIQESR